MFLYWININCWIFILMKKSRFDKYKNWFLDQYWTYITLKTMLITVPMHLVFASHTCFISPVQSRILIVCMHLNKWKNVCKCDSGYMWNVNISSYSLLVRISKDSGRTPAVLLWQWITWDWAYQCFFFLSSKRYKHGTKVLEGERLICKLMWAEINILHYSDLGRVLRFG